MLAFAALWNLSFAIGFHARTSAAFTIVGAVAAVVFALFAVRSFTSRTIARFEESGRFVVRERSTLFTHEAFDIRGFAVEETKDGSHGVVLTTVGSGARLPVPLPLDGFHIGMRGAERPFFGLTPRSWAAHIAEQLNEALDRARRSTTGLRIEAPVRVAPSEPRADARGRHGDGALARRSDEEEDGADDEERSATDERNRRDAR